jgi:hypothetical protein
MRLQFAADLGHHLAEAQQLQSERPLTSPVAASSGLGIRPDLIHGLSTRSLRTASVESMRLCLIPYPGGGETGLMRDRLSSP